MMRLLVLLLLAVTALGHRSVEAGTETLLFKEKSVRQKQKESPDDGKGSDGVDAPGMESPKSIWKELSEIWHDFWVWFWGLFFGKAEEPAAVAVAQAMEKLEYDDLPPITSKPYPLLDSFCLEEELFTNTSLVSCGCCSDHLVGDARAQAALLFKSGPVEAPAFLRKQDGSYDRVGNVKTWSLGGRTPAVVCDRGQLVCHCEDRSKAWIEVEPQCGIGKACKPPEMPSEGPSEEKASPAQAVGPVLAEEEAYSSDQEVFEGDQSLPICTASSHKSKRMSIGVNFCQDFTVQQCERLYARSHHGDWHYCKVHHNRYRRCGAKLIMQEEAEKVTLDAQSWALQNLYSPDTDWKVESKPSKTPAHLTRTLEDPPPEADVFEEMVAARMQKQAADIALAEQERKSDAQNEASDV
eukprot:TRINITY_DN8205_c0_g2_i1.p1 TRINITY_DN8205_c0_g2~~TRINITY_DN8205_c0_g2_i1.p1  ORF type:complete len:410 (+),score=87.07 TRINITY_DN8205_c0_g2_i1:144-1373(+)